MSGPVTTEDLAQLLSDGLDLCVRARTLDEVVRLVQPDEREHPGDVGYALMMKCATPALWVLQQHDQDLAAWEEAARATLARTGIVFRRRGRP